MHNYNRSHIFEASTSMTLEALHHYNVEDETIAVISEDVSPQFRQGYVRRLILYFASSVQ